MECILDCNYLLLKNHCGSERIQFHKNMECMLVYCNYLLLKSSAEESNAVLQGYGMYFTLYLSHIEGSAEERVKYSSTKIWNVF